MKARITLLIVLALALSLGLVTGLAHPKPAQAQPLGGLIALPIIRAGTQTGPFASATQVVLQVQNVGVIPTRAALFLFGVYSGYCESQAPGPLKVECSGLITPGSAWIWSGTMLPAWAASGVLKAVVGCPTIPNPLAVETSGVPLSIDVARTVPGDVDPQVTSTSSYGGIVGDAFGNYDPVFGGFTYYAPSVRVDDDGFSSVLYVQNAGTSCTSVELWLKSQEECLRATICEIPVLAPGEVYFFDPYRDCGVSQFNGSIWLRSSQPVGILVDTFGYNTRASYAGIPGSVAVGGMNTTGSEVNYGPLIYREYQGWETRIDVQNLNAVYPAAVKVYFLDQSGDIINTLVDWVCPRGSQTFWLPVINNLPGQYVGAIRVESQAGVERPVVPNITSVVSLTKYEGPAREYVLEALSYNLLTEPEVFDWQIGPGHGGLIGVPSLIKGKQGINSELVINNVNPNPGFTDFAIFFYDQNGLLDYVCQKLNEKQVEYIKLQEWGWINPGFSGSAVISATYTTQLGGFGLGAVVIERAQPLLGSDAPGDDSTGFAAQPITGSFNPAATLPGLPVCPGQPFCSATLVGFVVTHDGHPAPNAQVRLVYLGGSTPVWTGYTDASGKFTATVPAPHDGSIQYAARVTWAPGGLSDVDVLVLDETNPHTVADIECGETLVVVLALPGVHTISGFATEECWEATPAIPRLAGALVELWYGTDITGTLLASTTTNSEGYWQFEGVVENHITPYHVKICLRDSVGNTVCFATDTFFLDSNDVELWFHYDSQIPDLSAWCEGVLEIEVFCNNQLVTFPVTIKIARIDAPGAVHTVTTHNGVVLVEDLPIGYYHAWVDKDGNNTLDAGESAKNFTIVTPLERKEIDFTYCPPG